MEFSEIFKNLRLKNKLQIKEIAERIGVVPGTIYCWEHNLKLPDMCNILKICEEFKVSPNELFGYDPMCSLDEAQRRLDNMIDELDALCETIAYTQKKLNKLKGGE